MRHLPLFVLLLALTACKDKEDPVPVTSEDDVGDWENTGPFAPCVERSAAGQCGGADTFTTSGCDSGTLAGFDAEGVYTLHVRAEYPQAGNAVGFSTQAMRLSSSGEGQTVGGLSLDVREVRTDGSLFLSAEQADLQGRMRRRSYLGCRSPEPGRMQGCYVECLNGSVTARGTFDAWKVTPRPGEPEASGLALLSQTRVPEGTPVDVYVTKGHAYVVSLRGGLFVYDVRDAARPVQTARVYVPGDSYWNGVWALGDALYVASGDRGVLVFDIRDPATPVQVAAVPAQRVDAHTVFVHEGLLFAAAADPAGQVLLFDVSQPLQPVLLGTFQAGGFDAARSYGPHDMFAFEQRLYVNFWGAGYVIASLEDPAAPRELGRYRYARSKSHASAVARYGERLIAFEGGEDWGAHLRVLDVTDPAAPVRIGEWRLRQHISIHNMVLAGTRLYVAYYHEGVRVLDVSMPEQPREVAHFNTFGPDDGGRGESFYEGAIGIRVPGDGHIYVVDTSRGLLILREP